jgi:hypothetical protein
VDWRLVRDAAVYGPWDGVRIGRNDIWAVRVGPGQDEVRKRLDQTRLLQRGAFFEGPDGDAVFVYRCRAVACLSGS